MGVLFGTMGVNVGIGAASTLLKELSKGSTGCGVGAIDVFVDGGHIGMLMDTHGIGGGGGGGATGIGIGIGGDGDGGVGVGGGGDYIGIVGIGIVVGVGICTAGGGLIGIVIHIATGLINGTGIQR